MTKDQLLRDYKSYIASQGLNNEYEVAISRHDIFMKHPPHALITVFTKGGKRKQINLSSVIGSIGGSRIKATNFILNLQYKYPQYGISAAFAYSNIPVFAEDTFEYTTIEDFHKRVQELFEMTTEAIDYARANCDGFN